MKCSVRVTRAVSLPDEIRTERARRAPELGPRILFFSGGSALRPLSRALADYTHNSIHIITTFDSGGSSAKLREAFDMLSIGDVRNRLLALADDSVHGNRAVYRLLNHRLSASDGPLIEQLESLASGTSPRVVQVPAPMRHILSAHLRMFRDRMPVDFDLEGASLGNLVLTGSFLANGEDIATVIDLFSRLVGVRGTVVPVVQGNFHLAADLDDGSRLVGQHRITGKEAAPIRVPVRNLEIVARGNGSAATNVAVDTGVLQHIASADLICYPMGSFYTSLVANLLPAGIGRAVRDAPCPKLYIPNTGEDSEQLGLSLAQRVEQLLEYLRRDAGRATPTRQLLDFVLVDAERGDYCGAVDIPELQRLGVEVVSSALVSRRSAPRIDAAQLTRALISLAQ